MFNYPRKSAEIFLRGNFPICFVRGIEGSNDLAINLPAEGIPFYTELVYATTNVGYFPLQGTHECYAGSR